MKSRRNANNNTGLHCESSDSRIINNADCYLLMAGMKPEYEFTLLKKNDSRLQASLIKMPFCQGYEYKCLETSLIIIYLVYCDVIIGNTSCVWLYWRYFHSPWCHFRQCERTKTHGSIWSERGVY